MDFWWKTSIFTYLPRFYELFLSKFFYQKQVVQFLTLNSKKFSDLIYHVPFQRYFNCKNPQIQHFIKVQVATLKYLKYKKNWFSSFLGALHDEIKKKNIRSSFTFCISHSLYINHSWIKLSNFLLLCNGSWRHILQCGCLLPLII